MSSEEKNHLNGSGENINKVLSKTMKTASSFFALSVFTKVVNLLCNVVIMRNISKEAYGIAKVYLEFAFYLMVFFPRETIRKTAQKYCPDSDPKSELKKYYITCQLHSCIIILMSIFGFFLYFGFIFFSNEKVSENKIQLFIYILSGIIELFSEPIILYMNLHIDNKQVAITLGNFGRIITNGLLALYFHMDLWSFTLSRLAGTGCFVLYLLLLGIFKYKIDFTQMIPNIPEIIFKREISGVKINVLYEIFISFVKATGIKLVLQNFEKVILSFALKETTEEKAEYSFIVENFSFIIRFLLDPLEEIFYNLLNKIKSYQKKNSEEGEEDICYKMLRLFIKLILIFDTLLIGYVFVAGKMTVELVYSKKWSTPATEKIGKVYAVYIGIIAVNGMIESFANATNTNKQMSKFNLFMIVNSVLLICFSIIFSKFDICGLVIANALAMIIRINGHLYIIFSGKSEGLKKPKKSGESSLVSDIKLFLSEFFMTLPSFVSICICLTVSVLIKRAMINEPLVYGFCSIGFVGAINVFFIYLFEKSAIKKSIADLKTE